MASDKIAENQQKINEFKTSLKSLAESICAVINMIK